MNDLPFNYGRKIICDKGCKETLDNKHFLNCPVQENKEKENEYNQILNWTMDEKVLGLTRFKEENTLRKDKLLDSVC